MQSLVIIRSEFLREPVNIKMSGLKYSQSAHYFALFTAQTRQLLATYRLEVSGSSHLYLVTTNLGVSLRQELTLPLSWPAAWSDHTQ